MSKTARARRRLIWAALTLSALAFGCAKRYRLEGMVLEVDPPARRVVLSHKAIPGYMDAMVMPFTARRERELRALRPGAEVESRLVVRRGQSRLESIRIRPGAAGGVVEDQGDRIALPEPPEKVPLGAAVPDFSLTDQNGVRVRLADLRGRVVAVNFIYTRCPLPEVCPRLAANFAGLQRRFGERLGRDLALLSVTIDPEHDTPSELRKYAKIWNTRAEGWRFLTGSIEEVRRVAGAFGMVYWPEEGLITHTSKTGVVTRDGRLAALVDGPGYSARQLGDLIQKEMEKPW
ncbi:MAG: SCO family protein [Bryobacteraceae bacterium]|nr:SCO family protein [Bryobacteraceae bacterium]